MASFFRGAGTLPAAASQAAPASPRLLIRHCCRSMFTRSRTAKNQLPPGSSLPSLNHGLMISRMHFTVEMACRKSGGAGMLEARCQGGQIAGHKRGCARGHVLKAGHPVFCQEVAGTERLPVEPDALFTLRPAGGREDRQLATFSTEPAAARWRSPTCLRGFVDTTTQKAAAVQGGLRCPS